MLSDDPTISRRQFAALVGAIALRGVCATKSDERLVALTLDDWNVALNFLRKWLEEIGQFDDGQPEYLAVKQVVLRVEQQLGKWPSVPFARGMLMA